MENWQTQGHDAQQSYVQHRVQLAGLGLQSGSIEPEMGWRIRAEALDRLLKRDIIECVATVG
ncbi:hypothetical protein [Primorskyibacter flagellatus]|uniref:hypothetical protein n=1 Tax=Primorskyibacter flagellatus TaxID=1387277 RepID=UPI0015C4843B